MKVKLMFFATRFCGSEETTGAAESFTPFGSEPLMPNQYAVGGPE